MKKRSKEVILTGHMTGKSAINYSTKFSIAIAAPFAALVVAGCDPAEPDVTAYRYTSEAQCVSAQIFTPQACHDFAAKAQLAYVQGAPRFEDKKHCEAEWGDNKCEAAPANVKTQDDDGNEHSGGYIPFFAGFIAGQNSSSNAAYAVPAYRDRAGDYVTGNGVNLGKNAFNSAAGRTGVREYSSHLASPAPARFATRTAVISRGGFGGGGGHSFGG